MMIKILLQCSLFLLLASKAFAYVDSIRLITLNDGRQLLLMADDAYGYDRSQNQHNAQHIIDAAKNIATKNAGVWIDFSFADSHLYTGQELNGQFIGLKRAADNIADTNRIALVEKLPGARQYVAKVFHKNSNHLTFLSGDLGLAFAHTAKLPTNMSIRSNDPRRDYLSSLMNEEIWRKNAARFYRTNTLLALELSYINKLRNFKMRGDISKTAQEVLKNNIDEMGKNFHTMVGNFRQFVDAKFNRILADEEMEMSFSDMSADERNERLTHIQEYLKDTQAHEGLYVYAPVTDVLMNMFGKKVPPIMIVVLDTDNASELERVLQDMGVIENSRSYDAHDLENWACGGAYPAL